jgi:hypothetical protein
MRRFLLTALLASLTLAAPATAKEVQSVTVCGVGDCAMSKDPQLTSGMIDVGPPTSRPKAPAPFYRVTMAIGDGHEVFGRTQSSWVPSAGRMLAEDGRWLAVRPAVGRGLHRLTAGLAALPAAELPGFPTAPADVALPRPATRVTSSGEPPMVALVAVGLLLAAVAASATFRVRRSRSASRRQQLLGADSFLNRSAM